MHRPIDNTEQTAFMPTDNAPADRPIDRQNVTTVWQFTDGRHDAPIDSNDRAALSLTANTPTDQQTTPSQNRICRRTIHQPID